MVSFSYARLQAIIVPMSLFLYLININFSIGLIHFQFNVGHTNAVAFAGLRSQNLGVITIANAVFGSNPPINSDILPRPSKLTRRLLKISRNSSDTIIRKILLLIPYFATINFTFLHFSA